MQVLATLNGSCAISSPLLKSVEFLLAVWYYLEEVYMYNLRGLNTEYFLGRRNAEIPFSEVEEALKDKTVLLTGGGGSIGSELCRQIAVFKPKLLIILDIFENNVFWIEQELRFSFPELNLVSVIASVRDADKVDEVFKKYRPQTVFHAAAHKHVPFMETNPCEAVKNNVGGTLNVARCADKYGAERFTLVSSDKAVNSTSVMGATKRICEMAIQCMNGSSKTAFFAVRFGNVFASDGSVVPLFEKQIERGGPVTVTDKTVTRYFMTVNEAVGLILHAASFAKGGEIFVLDMGEPVNIYALAEKMILSRGLKPNEDIKIEITGLRTGEKLTEELFIGGEEFVATHNDRIRVVKPVKIDENAFYDGLKKLTEIAARNVEADEMKRAIADFLPEYSADKI